MLRTRVRKYVDETFGEGTYDEVLSGNMILIVNDNEYTPEYLTETNVYIRDNADVKIVDVKELGAEEDPEDSENYDTSTIESTVNTIALLSLEQLVGTEKLADVMAGIAVLAINGNQVVVRNLTDAALYNNLSEKDKILVVRAASGG